MHILENMEQNSLLCVTEMSWVRARVSHPILSPIKEQGVLPITDERMTRFMITLEQGVELVWHAFEDMVGGEIYVKKIPSMSVVNLAKALAPECKLEVVGIRP